MFVKVQFSGHRRSLAAGTVYPSRQVFSAEDCPHLAEHFSFDARDFTQTKLVNFLAAFAVHPPLELKPEWCYSV